MEVAAFTVCSAINIKDTFIEKEKWGKYLNRGFRYTKGRGKYIKQEKEVTRPSLPY